MRRVRGGRIRGVSVPPKKNLPSDATEKVTNEERATLAASVSRALDPVLKRETRMVQKVIRCSVGGEERFIRVTVESWTRPGPEKAGGAKAASEDDPWTGGHVLIVDDDEGIREGLAAF